MKLKKKLSLLMLGLYGCSFAQAQISKYSILLIPDSLKKNAHAVLREDDFYFEVKDVGTAIAKGHQVTTVLNEQGKADLQFVHFSDKFDYLDEDEIIVYDAMGTKIKTYKKGDMESENMGEGLVEDGKVTYFKVTAPNYPITVEENYVLKYKGILEYPNYIINESEHSVQHSSFEVIVPTNIGLRFQPMHTNLKPTLETDGQSTKYVWNTANIKANEYEKNAGPTANYLPYIKISPNKFKMDNYEGDFSSWKGFGNWNWDLYKTQNKLSEANAAIIKELVKNEPTDIDKAKKIYKQMQNDMRYVSIQLGIGGWKPFSADFVQQKKFGDCKALSNYMCAALDVVGIKSYVAIVLSGANKYSVSPDFPESVFNHVILCIPQPKDSIWLECTSKNTDFGVLGDFTENRNAVLVTENGGVLVPTPKSKPTENKFSCSTQINVDADGGAKATANMLATGEYKFEISQALLENKEDDKRRFFIRNMGWKQPDVLNFQTGAKDEIPFHFSANMNYEQAYSFKAGSKMFLPVRLYPIFEDEVPEDTSRMHDYYFEHPFQHNDTTTYHLPTGTTVEALPATKKMETSFGKYTCQYAYDAAANSINIIAFFEINNHVVPAAQYPKLLAFRKYIEADMGEKLVVKLP